MLNYEEKIKFYLIGGHYYGRENYEEGNSEGLFK